MIVIFNLLKITIKKIIPDNHNYNKQHNFHFHFEKHMATTDIPVGTPEHTHVDDSKIVMSYAREKAKPNFTQLQLMLMEIDAPPSAYRELRKIMEERFSLEKFDDFGH